MHDSEQCNNKINKTQKRDPKYHQSMPNCHPSVHPLKSYKNTHPQCKSLNNSLATAFHPHNDYFAAGLLLAQFLLAKEQAVGGFTMCSCSRSEARCSSATTLQLESGKRPRARSRMMSRYPCCLKILLWRYLSNVWEPAFVIGNLHGFRCNVSASSSDSSLIL